MIELKNIQVPLDEYAQGPDACLKTLAAERMGIAPSEVSKVHILKKSVDARRKTDVHFVMTLGVSLLSESMELNTLSEANVKRGDQVADSFLTGCTGRASMNILGFQPARFELVKVEEKDTIYSIPDVFLPENFVRPVVVGAGPAGLFAALYLAYSGLKPLLIERGASMDERVAAVEAFNQGADFDPVTNIQFGEGGAGTFSDGKLTTNTKNPLTKTVLDWFVEAGAPEDIRVDAKPHIGTDKLRQVVKNITQTIREYGGQVRFNTQLVFFDFDHGSLRGLTLEDTKTQVREYVEAHQVILAVGHSARDTFKVIEQAGFLMERKPFSVGVRIEHPQSFINSVQYGPFAEHPALGAADYKLSTHLDNGRGVYTFCMCPGGQVVAAASETGGVVVNGMSEYARSAENANSAVLVSVEPSDFPGTGVLAGVEFQRTIEHAAYELAQKNGGAPYSAPAQRVGDFLHLSKNQRASAQPAHLKVNPSYARGVAWSDLHECLPDFVSVSLEKALPLLDRKLHGFAHPDAIMTGVETRSSSPVRIIRDSSLQAHLSSESSMHPLPTGVFPAGEGAGYAGGIMSAAVDGLKTAKALVKAICLVDLSLYQRTEKDNESANRAASGTSSDMRRDESVPSRHLESDSEDGTAANSKEALDPEAFMSHIPVGEPLDFRADSGDLYQYQCYSTGEATIIHCVPATNELIIPTTIQGYVITELSSRLFDGLEDLEKLSLPAALKRLSHRSLSSLEKLKSLRLPAGFSFFDTRALSGLKSLEILELPDMMDRVPANLFGSCSPKVLVIGKNAREVADGAFSRSSLQQIQVVEDNPWLVSDGMALYDRKTCDLVALATPAAHYEVLPGCMRIRRKAFAINNAIRKVSVPDTLKVIEQFSFFRSSLEEFIAPTHLKSIGQKAFYQCQNLKKVVLNEGLTFIGNEAFRKTPLTELVLPASIENLGLSFCDSVRQKNGKAVPKISIAPGESLFLMEKNHALYKRDGSGAGADSGWILWSFLDDEAATFELNPGCTAIASSACYDKYALTYLDLPAGVKSIGDFAFKGCRKLQYVEGSEALESVGYSAFAGTDLKRFYLPETFKYCAADAFVLQESTSGFAPKTIERFEVHPENPYFRVESNFLCRKSEAEGDTALYCFSHESCLRIPDSVTALGPYCLSGARNAESLVVHRRIRTFARGSTRCSKPVFQITIDCSQDPFEGHTQFILYFPDNASGRDAIRYALEGDTWDLETLVSASDEVVYWSRDIFIRAKAALDRLSDPIFLSDKSEQRFSSFCKKRLIEVANLFAKKNYLKGFKQLADLHFLDENTIGAVIDEVNQQSNTEIVAYLLDFRRQVFHYDVMSEYDI